MSEADMNCPVCGYYCSGKGGVGCIDKKGMWELEQRTMPDEIWAVTFLDQDFGQWESRPIEAPLHSSMAHYTRTTAIPGHAKLVSALKGMRRERIYGMDEWRLVLPAKESDELYALLAALESEGK